MLNLGLIKVGWLWLTKPASGITKVDERRRVRLFLAVQFIIVVALLPMVLNWLPIDEGHKKAPFFWLFVSQLVAYGLGRTKIYKWGVIFSLSSMLGMCIYASVTAPVYSIEEMSLNLMWAVVPLLYGSMVFSQRMTFFMSLMVVLIYISMPFLIPEMDFIDIAPVTFLVGIWSIVHNLLLRNNELTAAQRRDELEQKADELTHLNDSLHIEISERFAAEARIEASLREKDVLLKEIHHRVKNNLQVISSLLNLQSNQLLDERDCVVFSESQNRIRAMSLIHEKLYKSGNLSQIDFGEYIENLTTYLVRSYGVQEIQMLVEAKAVYLGIDTAVSCGLILNELVSNALKHGFKDGRSGCIRITSQEENQHLALNISDNGVGIPPDLDIQQTSSLGLQLVHTLVNQLNGKIILNRRHGTEFNIIIPIQISA